MVEFKNTLLYLSRKDSKLGSVIKQVNPIYEIKSDDEFTSLIKIIIGQQLSGAAARTIIGRVEITLGNSKFNPKRVLKIDSVKLRQCGISNAKITYIKNLSNWLIKSPNFFLNLKKYNEDDLLSELCKIKGVGIWTASIFAMSTLNRQNIFPYGDVTLNKAINALYGSELNQADIISNWSPYKSNACRVLWQWVDAGMPKI